MKGVLETLIREGLASLGAESADISLEHPSELSHGDYATSVALSHAKVLGKSPREIAESLKIYFDAHKPAEVAKIEIAGPGFINFYLTKDFFTQSIKEIIEKGNEFGKNGSLKGEKIMVEHTDPNPFKPIHVGHLMPMTIGSTLARMYEWNGAEVRQACYQGDVGMHVAKAVWGMVHGAKQPYVFGNQAFEVDEEAKQEIVEINKKIYERSDEKINALYDAGRKASLEYFDEVYKLLGIHFDNFFFESAAAPIGKRVVEEHVGEIFEKSDGAIVFHAEKYEPSLHTRVFINSEGLPTYEAKELGLAKIKFDAYPYTKSIVVTGNEINDYFRVLLAAMKYVFPELREKTKHISHGMLRLPSGKMSSRTGDVIEVGTLIDEVREKVQGNALVAVGAIKYMILRQSVGGDIIFDIDKSVSTEGDSGVYLQYAYARTTSLLEKAGKKGSTDGESGAVREIEKLLYQFPETVERAMKEYAPNLITTYLTELAGAFNNFYAHEQIVGDAPETLYRLAVVEAFRIVMKNGLDVLGIPVLERM